MMRLFALCTVAAALLAGCATAIAPTSARLTYSTKPAGASLYEGSTLIGVAPVTRSYDGGGKPGAITTPEVTAVWPSGAKTTFFTVLSPGADREATLERPAAAPNLQVDLENAAKVEAAQKQEAQRTKDEILRDQKRDSARCRKQQQTGNVVTNDC